MLAVGEGVGDGVGDALGLGEALVSVAAGVGAAVSWLAKYARRPATMAATTRIATTTKIQMARLRARGSSGSSSSASSRRKGSAAPARGADEARTVVAPVSAARRPDGMSCVACVGVPGSARAAAPATAATAMVAVATSPRRSACAARARCAALCGRSAGFFAMHDITRLRTGSATVTGSSGGSSLICAMAMATCDSPVKGRRPARHSYATMPIE
ncbi:hypothetical protein CMMCAS04_00870 [Clavibacter michiganensis subsp. michiganensis]|nr:hypothetical protein CMMCAS04_00870 [Clavibacter michiganensis subsp. michiganensis]